MATKFYRITIPEYAIMPNATYADLFDNNKTTTDIQSGTVGGKQTTSLFIGDYNTAAQPTFGGGELVGAKLGLYINSITAGQAAGSAGLKAFKINTAIGNREGGKDAAGRIVTNDSVTQFCAYHTANSADYITEDFSKVGTNSKDVVETATNAVVSQHVGPYLSQTDGYKYGRNFTPDFSDNETVSANTHHNRYGQTLDDGTKIYKIEKDKQWGQHGWRSVKEKKLWWYRNNEWWDEGDVGSWTGRVTGAGSDHADQNLIKYDHEVTIEIPPEEKVQRITTDNTSFDIISNAETFRGTKTDISGGDVTTHTREAYSNFAFTSTNVLTGGFSLHLDSLYMHRENSASNPFYAKMKDTSGNDLEYSALQQTSFASKIVPMPVEVGNSNRKEKNAAGGHSPIPTIEIDVNVEEIAPMLVRFENHSSALGGARTVNTTGDDTGCAWRYRLNRSIVITFGSEAPDLEDSLFMYIKKHLPSAGSVGDTTADSDATTHFNPTWTQNSSPETSVAVSGDGAIATAKSFFGTAFVNHDGNFGFYNLEAFGGTNSLNFAAAAAPYDDISFRTDDVLGEVCFMNEPTILEDAALNNWMRMAFQVDPEFMGANYAIYDSKSGDVLKSPDKLVNVKSLYPSASDDTRKLKVPNREDWPKYMTIWQNNYQAIKGKFNTDYNNYETGLVHALTDSSGGDRSNVRLIQQNAVDSEVQDGAQLTSVPFHLIKPGTSVRCSEKDGTTFTNSNELGVVTHNTSLTSDGFLVVSVDEDKDYDKGQPFLYDSKYCVDSQVTSAKEDMRISAYIDAISFKNFNIKHQNATPNENNTVPKRLKIPAPVETIPFGYTLNNSVPTNVYDTGKAYANSYICLGFDNFTDLGFASNISSSSSATNVLMNEFRTINSSITDKIITNDDSEFSHIRAGYSSSVEDYGIQCRKKLTQTYNTSTGTQGVTGNHLEAGYLVGGTSDISPFFDNNNGTANYTNRGLKVGDDTNSYELGMNLNGSNFVDRFTQKGILQWNFDARTVASGSLLTANVTSTSATTIPVDDGTDFTVNQHIKIGNEVMKVTAISSNNLTVSRAQYGTTAATHDNDDTVHLIAVPEKRECLFVSARALQVEDSKTVIVDEEGIFDLPRDTEYIIYKHGDSHSSPTFAPRTVKLARKSNNSIHFNSPHGINSTNKFELMISPKKFWLVLEIMNIGGEIIKTVVSGSGGNQLTLPDTDGIQVFMTIKGTSNFISSIDTDTNVVTLANSATYSGTDVTFEATVVRGNNQNITKKLLPEKSYQNVVGITTDAISLGATFKESLFNDGNYINNWNLEAFEDSEESIVNLIDYGHGGFDDEKELGGHAGFLALNIQNDINKFKEIDISGVISTDGVETSKTVPILIGTDDPTESFKINIDTETGTNKTYMLSVFEDEIMEKPELSISPDEDNAFYPKFKWSSPAKDAWYGFIIVDDGNITNQYKNAVIHYPFNESGSHGAAASAPVEKISGHATTISGALYDVEGLAGNCLRFDGANNVVICTPSPAADPTYDGTADTQTEMSVVAHIVPDADISGENIIVSQYDDNSKEKFKITLNASKQIEVAVVMKSSPVVNATLTSSSVVVTDGETPTSIILTVDTTLKSGNVKLFINGKLEDLTGPSLAAGTSNNWQTGTVINGGNASLHIGRSASSSGNYGFDGKIEEVVIYKKCIYPISPNVTELLFTKPLSELVSGQSLAQSKSNTAKLFIKDYHNIRGSTEREVASSSQVSWRKAAFALDTS